MIFVDSTGSVDSNELVVTLFMIATCVGALPVDITIAGSKSQESYTSVFKMLRHLTETIDPHSAIDPDICLTDNDDGLCNALKLCGRR